MIILDLETTGFDKKEDKIIEFAAVKIDSNFKEIDSLEFLVNPELEVSDEVLKVTWINWEDLKKADTFDKNFDRVQQFLDEEEIIVGHNIQFDIWFLNELWLAKNNPSLDTFVLASIFLPWEKSYALEVLSDKYDIEHKYKHRAMWDVLANLDLFKLIVEKISLEKGFENYLDDYWFDWRYSDFVRRVFDCEICLKGDVVNDCNRSLPDPETSSEWQVDINVASRHACLLLDPRSSLEWQNSFKWQVIFEFSSLEKLKEKINSFLNSKEKWVIIFQWFLSKFLREEYEKYSDINFIKPVANYTNKEKFDLFIKDFWINDENEWLLLQVLFNIFKWRELSTENINVSYWNYNIWQYLIDRERELEISDKNLIDTKTWFDHKEKFSSYEKLFIEPRLDSEDSYSSFSINNLIDKLWKEEFASRLSEISDMFLDWNDLWKYWLEFEIDSKFKSENFYLNWALEEFLNDLKKELIWKAEFDLYQKNIENFLSWNSNYYNVIKITEKHFNLSSQKIDLLDWYREDFKWADFWFFWWFVNWNCDFLKMNFEISWKCEADMFPEIDIFYPNWPNDLWWKHPEFNNFCLNKISELVSQNLDKKIWIFTPSKSSLNDVYWFLLSNYPDLNLLWEWFSWWKNKTVHKLESSEGWIVFVSQKDIFEKVFLESDFSFDILIIFKMPFDQPGWVYKLRQNLLWWNFSNYALPKSMIKLKQVVLASWARQVHFLDKRVWTEQWARGFVDVLLS